MLQWTTQVIWALRPYNMSNLDKENVRFQKEWDERVHYIEAALQKGQEPFSVEDVYDRVCAGLAHFEPVEDGAAVFWFNDYPQRKLLRIWLYGGNMPSIEQVLDAAQKHAERLECDGIELDGRKGWERILKSHGFNYARSVLIKELN